MDARTKLAMARAVHAAYNDGGFSADSYAKISDAAECEGIDTEAYAYDDEESRAALAALAAEVAALDAKAEDDRPSSLERIAAAQEQRPTLRDQFAMAAVQGIAVCGGSYDETARAAYAFADAMLAAREVAK